MARRILLSLLLFCFAHAITCDSLLKARANCNTGYTKCSPNGAAATDEPPIGSALSPLYVDIVDSVQSTGKQARDLKDNIVERSSGGSLCCNDGTQCLLLQNFNLAFCYDNYTTNYFLPGGALGQITDGNYTAPDGSFANLISGNYTLASGVAGNIYSDSGASPKPNTATLNLPTQYTAAGSGSAIASTALGEITTYTTTIPGTTIQPSTVAAETISPIVDGGTTVDAETTSETTTINGAPTVTPETIAASIVGGTTVSSGTTVQATTIPGTTIPPKTSTVVTRIGGGATKAGVGSQTPLPVALFQTVAGCFLFILGADWLMVLRNGD